MLTEGGDPDKLGRGTYWNDEIQECIHQNHIYRVRFDLSQFSPAFLAAQLGSPYGKAYFLAHAKQTTGIATINQKVLGKFPLMCPSIKVQEEIASFLDFKKQEISRLTSLLEKQLNEINQLYTAYLHQPFNGEL